jgi:metal-responsive CopG/Arc/MetJ family transcriptional regulator
MPLNPSPLAERYRAYRRRLVAKGRHQLIVDLPRETVAFIDELKERHGLRNRSQVLMQLIEKGREAAQQQTT